MPVVSLARLWLFLGVALPVLAAVLGPLSTVDLTYQLRAGDGILRTGTLPDRDTWTFLAADQPWLDQQWGAQVVLAAIFRGGGWTGLVILRAALTALIVLAPLWVALGAGLSSRVATLLVLTAFAVAAPAMALRPQLLGMACFALTLILISERRRHPRLIWLVPVAACAWANLHGSFVLAPLMLGLAWLEDLYDRRLTSRTMIVALAATIVATCLTPHGPTVWGYAVGLGVDPEVTRRISEWQPSTVRTVPGLLFIGSMAAVVVYIARRVIPTPWPTLAWLGVFAALGLYAERGVAWWPWVAAVVIAPMIAASTPDRAVRGKAVGSRRLNAAVAGVIAAAVLFALPLWRPTHPGTGVPIGVLTEAPLGVATELRALVQPGDRVLNPQLWGSWLEWAVPDARYAVDSRIELVPGEAWLRYESMLSGTLTGSEDLDRLGVDWVVGTSEDDHLRSRLMSRGWIERYRDADGYVLGRTPS
jgi:hypothetical protein